MKKLLSALITLSILGYVVMLLAGAAHSGTPAIPAIGYLPTVALILAARLAIVDVSSIGKGTK